MSFFEPARDSRIAGDLLKILADAKQVVPDWLAEAGGVKMTEVAPIERQSVSEGDVQKSQEAPERNEQKSIPPPVNNQDGDSSGSEW